MKRILQIITPRLCDDGMSKIALEIYDNQRDCYEIAFASNFEEKNPVVDKIRDKGAALYLLPPKSSLLAYGRAIQSLVREQQVDAVYIHGNSALMYIEACAVKKAGAKVITHCHNTASDHPLLHKILKPSFNRLVDVKIACSKAACAWAYDDNHTFIIANGIDVKKYGFDPQERRAVRNELNLGDALTAGFVGRLQAQKNPLFLLAIFRELVRIEPNARLLIIGEGEARRQMEEEIQARGLRDSVQLLGAQEDVLRYYQAMDIVLMPSLYEGLPLVPLEAQANGLPVLLSDVCSEEVFFMPLIEKMSLEASAEMWANRAVQLAHDVKRGENTEDAFARAALTKETMQGKIREVLTQALSD